MTTGKSTRRNISIMILALSTFVWVLLLLNPGNLLAVRHCAMTTTGPSTASWQMMLAMNPIPALLTGWTLMVVAMMLPKVIGAILYICERSLKRRRLRSALLFAGSYIGIWVITGIPIIFLIFGLNLLFPNSFIPAVSIGLIALIWQCSPIKQRCLNRGHNHRTLAAFGWKADRDAIVFGLEHGLWCVGSGWALMLFPMLLPVGHNLAMLAVTVLMISEHLEHPLVPRWRFNFSSKLLRGLYAQTRIRLDRAFSLT